jgi:hypothetical protein
MATAIAQRTVASIVSWDADDFGILIEYGDGEWRKYRVGTRAEAIQELQRLSFDKRQGCLIGK